MTQKTAFSTLITIRTSDLTFLSSVRRLLQTVSSDSERYPATSFNVTLKMAAARFSENSLNVYQTLRPYIPGINLINHRPENLKSHTLLRFLMISRRIRPNVRTVLFSLQVITTRSTIAVHINRILKVEIVFWLSESRDCIIVGAAFVCLMSSWILIPEELFRELVTRSNNLSRLPPNRFSVRVYRRWTHGDSNIYPLE